MSAKFWQHTYLSHVPNVVAHARAQNDPRERVRFPIDRDERRFRIKRPAAGKANDIIQKTQRAAECAVLVVDFGIDVTAVCSCNYSGRSLVVVLGPAPDFELRGKFTVAILRGSQRQGHKQASVAAEPLVDKRFRR